MFIKIFFASLFFVLTNFNFCQSPIRINQVGYLPYSKKIAFFVLNSLDTQELPFLDKFEKSYVFYVKDEKDSEVLVKEAKLYNLKDSASGDTIYIIDFSELTKPAKYYIQIKDIKSYEFLISSDVYKEVLDLLLAGFYLQRCGEEVSYESFSHKRCHIQDKEALIYGTTKTKDVFGGWHDAGNYEKYVSATAISCWYLLAVYEVLGNKLEKNLKQRLLDEIKYALNWLVKMQDEDGGVYHSVVVENWDYWPCLPEEHKDKRIISPKSITATLNFVSVLAKTSYLFRDIDKNFSSFCLKQALKSYKWFEKNLNLTYKKITETDAYIDDNYLDEQLLALCELYRNTKDQLYHKRFLELLSKLGYKITIPSWQDTTTLAVLSYLFEDEIFIDKEIKNLLLSNLEKILKTRSNWVDNNRNGYRVALFNSEYYWGSNGVLGNISFLLTYFSIVSKDKLYASYALEQIHYLLGRNALDKCFISGVGKNTITNHHYALSIINKKVYPGFVSGGPNADFSNDELLNFLIGKFTPKAKCFVDDGKTTSWASNEPCILYNAPWIFVFSYFAYQTN